MSVPASQNSATGTRTRVARVRAEYPNQLDYSGADILDEVSDRCGEKQISPVNRAAEAKLKKQEGCVMCATKPHCKTGTAAASELEIDPLGHVIAANLRRRELSPGLPRDRRKY